MRLIRDAGKTPVERDALYNGIKVYGEEDVAAVMEERYRPVQRSRESPRAGRPLEKFAPAPTSDETETAHRRRRVLILIAGLFVYLYNSIDSS